MRQEVDIRYVSALFVTPARKVVYSKDVHPNKFPPAAAAREGSVALDYRPYGIPR
jgi:hypothetical protein